MLKSSRFRFSLLFAMFLIIVLLISPVSSLDGKTMEGNIETINDIDFFIPNEYEFNQNATDAFYDYQGGNVFKHHAEIKSYTSQSGDNITIMVGDAENANVDLWIKNGHPLFTVNNKKGTLDEMTASGNYLYSYIEDDKMVSIYVEDPDMLEWIVM